LPEKPKVPAAPWKARIRDADSPTGARPRALDSGLKDRMTSVSPMLNAAPCQIADGAEGGVA